MDFWRLLFVIWILILSACTATGPIFKDFISPDPDKGMIYILRPMTGMVSHSPMLVYIDNEPQRDRLRIKGYQCYQLSPGKHIIRFEMNLTDESLKMNSIGCRKVEKHRTATYHHSSSFFFQIGRGQTKFFLYKHAERNSLMNILLLIPSHVHEFSELPFEKASAMIKNLRLSIDSVTTETDK